MKIPLNSDTSQTSLRYLWQGGVRYGPYAYDIGNSYYNPKVVVAQASGTNTPGYWKLRRKGQIIPANAYQRLDYTGESSSVWDISKSGVRYAWWEWSNGSASHQSSWRYDAATDAYPLISNQDAIDEQYYRLQQAASKIYSSGWDAMTFIGELKDTIRMFNGMKQRYANDIGKIFQKIDRLRDPRNRGKWKTASDVHDILANGWLEGRYGWRTLAYDMQDIAKALARINSQRQRFRERVPGSATKVTTAGSVPFSWTFCDGTHVWRKVHTYQPSALVVADISPPKIAFNPGITAWELAPLSFVVDRFVNVGQYLESMSFLALAINWTGSVSYMYTMESEQDLQNLVWKSPYTGTYKSRGKAFAQLKVRHPMTTLPQYPLVKVRLDLWFGLDLVELVAQRFKAPRKTFALLLDSYRGR